jgi:hypothetical protein
MGVAKIVPGIFAQTRNSQPLYALGASVFFSGILLSVGDITILAQMTDVLLFAVFAVMNAVILKLHWKKDRFNGFRVPLDIGKVSLPALLGLVSSAGMLLFVDVNALLYSAAFFTVIAAVMHWWAGRRK